jgi:hypothetical protein
MEVWPASIREKRGAEEVRDVASHAGAPRLIQKFMHDLSKVTIGCGVNRGWFNKRLAPHSPILIQQSSALVPEHIVANRKRAIKIAQVELAEVLKDCDGIVHVMGWRSNSAANPAISAGTSA